ncbi:MAG: hypothetical protein FLDDKLPJ_01185 [Phycisphaerae bacterium]|nr:hypothetical protein [Phycisphaerae bacterium]
MTAIFEFDATRLSRNLILRWDVAAHAVADGEASAEILAWIDRRAADVMTLQPWVEHRENVLATEPEADVDAVSEALALEVRGTPTWASLLECGFERTFAQTPVADRERVQREMTAVLFNPELLGELIDEVMSAERLPIAWKEIIAGAQAVEARVFALGACAELRVRSGGGLKPGEVCVELEERDGALHARVRGLGEFKHHVVDAVLADTNTDEVFTVFPACCSAASEADRRGVSSGTDRRDASLKADRPGAASESECSGATGSEQGGSNFGAWKAFRGSAAVFQQGGDAVIREDGTCEILVPLTDAARPLADKVLVIAIGRGEKEREPAGRPGRREPRRDGSRPPR